MSDSRRKSTTPWLAWQRTQLRHCEDIDMFGRIARTLYHRVRYFRSEATRNEIVAHAEFLHRHCLLRLRSRGEARWLRKINRCAAHTERVKAIRDEVDMWLDDVAADRSEDEALARQYANDCAEYDEDPHACRTLALSEWHDGCSPRMWQPPTPPAIPLWQQLETAQTFEDDL